MTEKTKELNFYQRVADLQAKIKVEKTQRNDFGKYNYRNAEGILLVLKPMLLKYSFSMDIIDDLVFIGERYYIKSTINIYDLDDRTQKITAFGFARECLSKPKMSEEQATGSASTFAHKYALQNLLLLDDSVDDPDAHDNSIQPDQKINQDQINRILKTVNQIAKNDKDEEKRLIKSISDSVQVNHLADIWQSWFDNIINKLEKQVK